MNRTVPSAGRRPARGLEALFEARSVAIVGASPRPEAPGGQALRNLVGFGYEGAVYPVNPRYDELAGLCCFASVADLPGPCDAALISVPPALVEQAVRDCGASGIGHAVIITSGFREAGDDGAALEAGVHAAARETGIRVVGPNTLGIMNVHTRFHCGFGGGMSRGDLPAGSLAMVAQSGGWGMGTVSAGTHFGLGFHFVAITGNETDVNALELAEFFLDRADVSAVVLLLEGSSNGFGLRRLGEEALARGKPILIWKIGVSQAGRRAASSHTGRMTGDVAVFEEVIRAGGFIEVGDLDDIVDLDRLFRYGKFATGGRTGIITISGGIGVLVSDLCEDEGLSVPGASRNLQERLLEEAGFVTAENPIDLTPQIFRDGYERHDRILQIVLESDDFDQLIFRGASGANAQEWVRHLVEVEARGQKPLIILHGSGAETQTDVTGLLDRHLIPSFHSARRAVRALAAMRRFQAKVEAWRARSGEPIARLPLGPRLPDGIVDPVTGSHALADVGIATLRQQVLDPGDATPTDENIPFPVAVKLVSPDVPHKTEAGAVRLGLPDAGAVRSAAKDILESVRAHSPHARIEGILVQEMAEGAEAIVGAIRIPGFGHLVAVGMGGVATELFEDVARRFAPVSPETAKEMIAELRMAPLLSGFRGSARRDIDALAEMICGVSRLVTAHPEIAELDLNPVMVRDEGMGAVAVDVLIRVSSDDEEEESG